MREKDIMLREFIYVYAISQGSGGYGERPATRAKRLGEAIYGQPEVLDTLREYPASSTAGIVTAKALRKEMKALEGAGDICLVPIKLTADKRMFTDKDWAGGTDWRRPETRGLRTHIGQHVV